MNLKNLNDLAYFCTTLLGGLMIVGAVVALAVGSAPTSPPAWLVAWTDWLVGAVTVTFAPIVLVSSARALQKFAGLA